MGAILFEIKGRLQRYLFFRCGSELKHLGFYLVFKLVAAPVFWYLLCLPGNSCLLMTLIGDPSILARLPVLESNSYQGRRAKKVFWPAGSSDMLSRSIIVTWPRVAVAARSSWSPQRVKTSMTFWFDVVRILDWLTLPTMLLASQNRMSFVE